MDLLPGVQLRDYTEALVHAFDESELKMMLRMQLNKRLDILVGPGALRTRVFELIGVAEQEGWDWELIAAAYHYRPRNRQLADIYEKYGLATKVTLEHKGTALESAPTAVGPSGFERIVKPHLDFLDFGLWQEMMAEVERWVCRIESGGSPMGTGFLVGPDLVLTNYHVMEGVISGDLDARAIVCRFGYKRLRNNLRQMGTEVGLSNDWDVDHSPYSVNERNNSPDADPPPTENELDFALIRLNREFGREPVNPHAPDSARRGWVRLKPDPPVLNRNSPLLIAQHPDGAPLKLALDTEANIALNSIGTRVRYSTNTESGSSGSPCFDIQWNLYALHHYGDPAYGHKPHWNQGIPIGMIWKRIGPGGGGFVET